MDPRDDQRGHCQVGIGAERGEDEAVEQLQQSPLEDSAKKSGARAPPVRMVAFPV